MDTIQTIYTEFACGELAYIDAIERVQSLGESPKEAERIVSEWADGLEQDARPWWEEEVA